MYHIRLLCLALSAATPLWSHAQSAVSFTDLSLDAEAGRALFERVWVTPPSSTAASDGLGPLYNARSCVACHMNGGRGRPLTQAGQVDVSLVMHLSGASVYGRQLQLKAVPGQPAEAQSLIPPHYQVSGWQYGQPDPSVELSPRIAPELAGIARLADLSDEQLLALADPDDKNSDGISGRLPFYPEQQAYGRFGWRSEGTSLAEQSARALALDIGVGNPWYPSPAGDCTAQQTQCQEIASATLSGESPEAAEVVIDLLVEYIAALPVPAVNDESTEGRQLFHTTGCSACHTPAHQLVDSGEEIRPYTDLLLHDMGEALADRNMQGEPGESEWRTPPLWGMAERRQLDEGYQTWLHDGRARSVEEAILWHGGEAGNARRAFQSLPDGEKGVLLEFVEGL